jgi:hypothetical protein
MQRARAGSSDQQALGHDQPPSAPDQEAFGVITWLAGLISKRRYAIHCHRGGVRFHRTVLRETLARIRSLRAPIPSMYEEIRERATR